MNSKKIIPVAAALLAVVILIAISVSGIGVKRKSYDVVFFGDSRVGNDRTETALSSLLEESVGLSVYNAGIGGTTLAVTGTNREWDRYSMVSLSEAFANDDFALQAAGKDNLYYRYSEIIEYVPDTVNDLSKIDLEKAEYIIIEQGTNDYLSAVPLYNEADAYDVTTVGGALRTTVRNLKKAAPDAKIIVVSQCLTYTLAGYGDELDLGYGTEKDYAEFERKVAGEEGVLFVDLYNESGINRENILEYLYDGLHPNDRGNGIITELISKTIRQDRTNN